MIKGKYLMSRADGCAEVIGLRRQIPEFSCGADQYDDMAFYALVYTEDDKPGACGRLYIDEDSHFRIDYLGVLPEERMKYMGDLTARMLLYKAQELNAPRVVADVPDSLVYFFARYGFKLSSSSGGTSHMNVEADSIRLEGKCSKGNSGSCAGDCENCQ